MSFKDLALPLIERGLYVFPLSADGRKIPLIKDWPNMASNQRDIILHWDAVFRRDINVGIVCRGIHVLDDDRGDLAEQILADTGHELPPTYTVITSVKKGTGKHGKHYYFTETPESAASGFHKLAGVYDWQTEHHQVVGAGCKHHSGAVYTEVDHNRTLLPVPDWLLDWVEETSEPVKTTTDEDTAEVSSRFDFEEFCAHFSPLFTVIGTSDNYYFTDPCPWAGHKHQHSPRTGFFYDGSVLGWNDFVTSCEGCGKNAYDTVRYMNQRMEELGKPRYDTGLIWETIFEVMQAFNVEEDPPVKVWKYHRRDAVGDMYSDNNEIWYNKDGVQL